MSFTNEEHPVEGQDPQATPDPTVVAEAAPVVQTPAAAGPWSADLARAFEDDQQRAAVDSFLRETVQPYTTRLEERARTNEQAVNLWTQLESDPINTYVQMTYEMMGEEAGNAVLERLQQVLGEQEQPPAAPEQPQEFIQGGNQMLSPEDQAALDWVREQQARTFYDEQLAQLRSKPENADLIALKDEDGNDVLDGLGSFVHVTDGDFDAAAQLLRGFIQRYGIPGRAMPRIPDPPAPNVFGSDTTSGQTSATPTQAPKQTLDQAIDEFMREDRERRNAPPMGAV